MASEVLKQKRKNLININRHSPEIFINKNFVDLFGLFLEEEIIGFFESKSLTELAFDKNKVLTKMMDILSSIEDRDEFLKTIESYGYSTDEIKNNDVIKEKKSIIKKFIDWKLDTIENIFNLNKQSNSEYFDSSKWCLYLCFNVLEGAISNLTSQKELIRAPLFCLPISIKKDAAGFYIQKRQDFVVNNEILKLFLQDFCQFKYADNGSVDSNFMLDVATSYLSDTFGWKVNKKYSSLVKLLKEQISNTLEIKKHFFLAYFDPIGGKMIEDYDTIINSDYQFPQNNGMFDHINIGDEIYATDEVAEINRPLNLIQKKAILSCLKTNTLIYGPPGTGKSEVVTNIICNNIINSKNVLVVSEKKAAVDVILERLDKLNNITLNVYDENDNKLFDNIIELNKLIIDSNNSKINLNHDCFTQLLKYFNKLSYLSKWAEENKLDVEKDIVSIFNNFDCKDYKKYEQEVGNILNKVKSFDINIGALIEDFYLFDSWAKVVSKHHKIESSIEHLFDVKKTSELNLVLSKMDNQYKKFVTIHNFIETGKIKKPLLVKKIDPTDEIYVSDMAGVIEQIANTDHNIFFIHYEQWKPFFAQDRVAVKSMLKAYILINDKKLDILSDVKFNQLNIHNLLNNYWDFKSTQASTIDHLVCDFYLHTLKQKFLASKPLQERWVELVKRANLPNKLNNGKVIKQYYDILKFVYPIWILSPDNVASFIPLNQHEFACGIFDEASQMRLERSIPLVYRCSNNVVSGDDKQLRPAKFFNSVATFDEDELTELDELDNVESLLDKAKTTNWVNFTLSNHYRSINEQLIEFSNKYIYENNLLCITKNNHFYKAIDAIELDTIYSRSTNTNPDEAKKVFDLLVENKDKYSKIVVITFNQKQTNLIENMCYQNAQLTSMLENFTLRIRSIENVQGDEADLAIISTTFGKDEHGKFIQNFGPVGQSGGMNRINVMITRAKEKMIVVKSFKSSDITSTTNKNLHILKMFFNFVENLQLTTNPNKSTSESTQTDNKLISVIQNSLQQAIGSSVSVVSNFKVGNHTFDLSILDKQSNKVLLNLFVDSLSSIKTNTDNKYWLHKFDQQRYFADRGYSIIRTNEFEWLLDKNNIVKGIVEKIK